MTSKTESPFPRNQINTALSLVALSAVLAFTTTVNAAIIIQNASSTISGGAGLTVSSTDLVNQGQATFLNYTSSVTPDFGAGTVNNGVATNLTTAGAFYRAGSGQLPTTLVFNLDVSTNTLGYDITQIDSLAGWQGGSTQTYANQNYTVEYRVVGNPNFLPLTSVSYNPFSSTTSNDPAYSQSTITESAGVLASGVNALRFVYSLPTISGGTNAGLVLQEIDVQGVATIPEPSGALLGVLGLLAVFGIRRR